MNVEAENMIDRFVWRRLVPGLVLLVVVLAAVVYFFR
jgi:hypothetical protein